jgi:glycosyltransferase involved in cell wall biosynthesis
MKISVCMASYNGAKYIKRQLSSIICQIGPNDQVVIVDDGSTDNTVQIINSFHDSRIQLHINSINLGVVKTFERALHLAIGDIIFLSDQDDRWSDNKIAVITKIFLTQDVDLILHDAVIVNGSHIISNSLHKSVNSSTGLIKNIVSNTYTGCCMAFKSKILTKVLPIPLKKGIFHDSWIGIMSKYYGYKVALINIPLIEWNRHGQNVSTTTRRKIIHILSERIILLFAITKHIIRNYFKKNLAKFK